MKNDKTFFKNISTILKKELHYYFKSLSFYIILALFLAFNGWFFTADLFIRNNTSLDSILGIIPIILLFFIPALTMHSFAEERKTGTIEILFTKPLTDIQIILGKYISTICIYTIMLLSVFIIDTVILFSLSTPDIGVIFGGFLSLLLYGITLIAIGILASSTTSSQMVGFLISIGISSIYFLTGKFLGYFPIPIANFLDIFIYDSHFENIAKGVIDSRSIIYFILVISFLLFITHISISYKNIETNKKAKTSANISIFIGLISFVIITVSIHIISLKHYIRLDMTSYKLYTLTDTTKQIVSHLDDDVVIKCYFSNNIPSYRSSKQYLKNILEEYKIINPTKIQYEFEDPISNKKIEEEALLEGIQPLATTDRTSASTKVDKVYMGFVISTNGKKEVFPAMTSKNLQNLEYSITSVIHKLQSSNEKTVYITQGNKIPSIESELSDLYQIITNNYNLKTLKVFDETDQQVENIKIPNADMIIVIDSPNKYSNEFISDLETKIKSGYKVLFLDNPIYTELSGKEVNSTPTQNNFTNIFSGYGIIKDNKIIGDSNALTINVVQQYGNTQVYNAVTYPLFPIITNLNNNIPFLNPIKSIVYPFGTSYKINPVENINIIPIAQTSEKSFTINNNTDINPLRNWEEVINSNTPNGHLEIGYIIKSKTEPINIAVIGSVDIVSNIISARSPDNFNVVLGIIDNMIADIDMSSIRAKNNTEQYLNKTSYTTQDLIKYLSSAIIPIIILIIGSIKFYARRKLTA